MSIIQRGRIVAIFFLQERRRRGSMIRVCSACTCLISALTVYANAVLFVRIIETSGAEVWILV